MNPIAGGRNKASTISSIKSWAQSSKVEYYIYETTGKNDSIAINEKLEEHRPQKVVSVGGDGTLLLCVNLLKHKDTALGIIPMGFANGMATELDIPGGLERGLKIIQTGKTLKVDLISFNDGEDLGIHISDLGLNARLVQQFEQNERRGFLGYAQGMFREYLQPENFQIKLTADGKEYNFNALMIAFANAKLYGTGARLNSKGKLDDGLMEVCVLHKLELTDLAEHWFDLVNENSEHIEVIQCKSAEVELTTEVAFQIDGEVKPATKKVKAEMLPKALNLIVP